MSCTYIFLQSLLILEYVFILKRQCRCSFRFWLRDSLFVRALPSSQQLTFLVFFSLSSDFLLAWCGCCSTVPISVKYLIVQRLKKRQNKKCACSHWKCTVTFICEHINCQIKTYHTALVYNLCRHEKGQRVFFSF